MSGERLAPVLTRRATLRLLATTVGFGLVAACAPISQPSPPAAAPKAAPTGAAVTVAPAPAAPSAPAPAAPARPAAEQPKSGGTLRIGTTYDIFRLSAYQVSPSVFDTLWTVCDTLTRYDKQLKPQPQLAESWDVSTDQKQIKLNLRKGVTFHSGREFTSEDVKFNLEWVRDPKANAPALIGMSQWWNAIETPDKNTVILKSEAPRPAMFDLFEYMNIVDKETLQGPDGERKVVGTGPFTFVEWVQGSHQRYVKNKNYWQSGRPYLDELRVQVNSDAQTALIQLESGAVDALLNPPLREAARLRRDPKFQLLVNEATGQYWLVAFNTTVPPLEKKEVRQALNFAIDRKRFADTVLLGIGEPRSLPWAPQSPAYDAVKNNAYSFDLEKAKSLMAKAGVPDADLDAVVVTTDFEPASLAQIMQADYSRIGTKLSIKAVEAAQYNDMLQKRTFRGLTVRFSGLAAVEPQTLFQLGTYYRLGTNASGFKSDRYEQLIKGAASEPDAAKRKQIYSDLNDLLLDESWVSIVASYPTMVAMKPNVRGLFHSMHEALIWTDTWLA